MLVDNTENVEKGENGEKGETAEKNLSQLSIGEVAQVKAIKGSEKFKEHLVDIGIVVGTELTLMGVAPLGDPIMIRVRRSSIAIRRHDARKILTSGL